MVTAQKHSSSLEWTAFLVQFLCFSNPLNPQNITLTWISEFLFYENKLGQLSLEWETAILRSD